MEKKRSNHKRDVDFRKARRKQRLARVIYHSWHDDDWQYYDNLHQYSKNKIHCSCPCCSVKTRNKGHRRNKSGNYALALNYRASELRKIIAMEDEMREYGFSTKRRGKRCRYADGS